MEQKNKNQMFQNIPPHDIEAEQAVLSSMFMDSEAAAIAIEHLTADDFYRPDNKLVFEAAQEIYIENKPIDVITIKSKLEEKQVFEQIGGISFLADIASAVGSSVNVKYYAKIVAEKSLLRNLIKVTGEISAISYEGKQSPENIIEKAEKAIFDIAQNRKSKDFVNIRDVALSVIDRVELIYKSKSRITGIATGFLDFDAKTAGLQKSDLILLAARPSMGKTAFALNIVQYVAINSNIPTAVFSLEMSKEQLVSRIISAEAMIDAQRLKTGNLEDEDWESIINSMNPISSAPIYIDDTPGISPMEIRSKCRRLKIEKGLGLIIIDYLQLMSGSGSRRNDSRQQEISEISRSLKAIAREMDVPIIALSQLSRACEQRADHRPILSDLRESGAIEQDADVVVFLYRDEYYFPDSEKKGVAELIIAKQRNGPTGTVELAWLGKNIKFGNLLKN